MCDPLTMIMGAASMLTPLLSSPPKPPKAKVPAAPAPNARAPGATVRIGTGADDKRTVTTTADRNSNFKEKRKAAVALGSLGRSGLAL